ncbi:MAG: hypothetical protein F6K31_19455 [Symploca sp. SIO2G7]|nr:hypothetical protein [Symploca sp. SIO2G7]
MNLNGDYGDWNNADKLRLVQLVLAQLVQEEPIEVPKVQHPPPFDPRPFFGISHQPKQVIDDYLASTRDGWL